MSLHLFELKEKQFDRWYLCLIYFKNSIKSGKFCSYKVKIRNTFKSLFYVKFAGNQAFKI